MAPFRIMPCRHAVWMAALALSAYAATPRPGWVLAPGAEDLIQSGAWSCNPAISMSGGAFTVTAGTSFDTIINTTGPLLKVNGDFSVLATLSASTNAGAWLTLVGSLNTGSNFWDGLKRLDVGYSGSAISASYWTGTSANPTAQTFQSPAGPSAPINLEIARIGTQIEVFVDGSQIGSFEDPGLFASGQVYLGVNVAPQNSITISSLAAAMPAGSSTVSLSAPYLQVAARSGTGLRDLAEPAGFLFGAAVDPSHFSDPGYVQAVGREFNLMVPENAMKFAETEPAPHSFNFCAADQLVAYAQANGMKIRGHNLVWQQDLPSWLTNGHYSSADASSILQEHIDTVVGHYKGKLIEWDVVNEAIAYSSPYGPQPSYWLTQLGSGYIDQAFQWAHAADPNVKLFYNDTGGEGLGAKSDAVYNLVKGLVSRGVPINGVGLQMHVSLTSAPSVADMSSNIARLGALGLEVHITEMDVRVPTPASAANLSAAAAIYQNVLAACQANANCSAILTWGVSDAYSWIPGTYPGFGAALLLDTQYQPKPAYTALAGMLQNVNRQRPIIATGGVVVHGGTATVVSPGSLVDIYGTNLAPAPATSTGAPLPASLGTVQVTVNGSAAPLYYVSPGLVIFQMPYEIQPGPALIQVSANGVSGGSAGITTQAAAPSLLTYNGNRAVAQDATYKINGPANCAVPGSYLTAYLMGSGPLDNSVATGAAAPPSPLSRETLATTAMLGNTPSPDVQFAGLTPGLVGLVQVNFQVPNVSGDLPLIIQIGSFSSNPGLICVGSAK